MLVPNGLEHPIVVFALTTEHLYIPGECAIGIGHPQSYVIEHDAVHQRRLDDREARTVRIVDDGRLSEAGQMGGGSRERCPVRDEIADGAVEIRGEESDAVDHAADARASLIRLIEDEPLALADEYTLG